MTHLGPYPLDSIITGDARELAKAIPDQSAALAFADPPYWVGFKYNGKTDADMDYIDPTALVAEMLRVAPVAMVTPGIANIHRYPAPYWVIGWLKLNAQGRNASGGANAWEPVLVYGKCRIENDTINAPIIGNRQADAAFHTCPKPLRLMLHIVEKYSKPGDVVVDWFMGSATTAVAAKILHRHWLGFEIDATTAERARQRVLTTQAPLVFPEPEQLTMEV